MFFTGKGYRGLLAASLFFFSLSAHSATIGADGGITLYISYDNLDVAGGVSWNDNVTQVNVNTGASCGATNSARSNAGAPPSPGSCPSGDTCLGREKLLGDVERFAEHLYQATEGNHYLRRVYLSDQGRAWSQADIRWNVGSGGASAPAAGWSRPFVAMNLNSANRRCIHDVFHHEFGHYMYDLPDRYARSGGYYRGTFGAGTFDVDVDIGDPNTVMTSNFPHRFVDTTNAEITVSYDPGTGLISGEVLTPALLTDGDPSTNGPNRAHHGFSHPFAQDEWSHIPLQHVDLFAVHVEGDFPTPDLADMPAVDVRFRGEDEPYPGTVLLLDRSGSMGVTTNGITAVQYVQEAGMYLYHSALPSDFVGTHLYNSAVEVLFDYEEYDPSNQLPFADFRNASGMTNIAAAIESAIDTLIAQHTESGVNGAQIALMSDGIHNVGDDLWNQVGRAQDLGIIIHTFSFGNADTATMEAIAATTDGAVFMMSEQDDGSELKLGMNRKLSEIRGNTPLHLHKGILMPNTKTSKGAVYESTFNVPEFSRALQFYAFLEKGNAADHELELIDSEGNIYTSDPQNLAHKGRMNGITVKQPLAGTWKYRIHGSTRLQGMLPRDDAFELMAFTRNLDLMPSAKIEKSHLHPGKYLIQGQLLHRYPLMNIDAVATIYRGNQNLGSVKLRDDGQSGIDAIANDGVYSALVDPAKFGISDKSPKIRVDIAFTTNEKSVPAKAVHYEIESDYKELVEHYKKLTQTHFTTYTSDIVSLRDTSRYQPRITPVRPTSSTRVTPGTTGTLEVWVDNMYLDQKLTRAGLGQGIRVDKLRISPDPKALGSKVLVEYSVLPSAHNGPRQLRVQSNAQSVSSEILLEVTKGKYVPDDSPINTLTPLKPQVPRPSGSLTNLTVDHHHHSGPVLNSTILQPSDPAILSTGALRPQ